jgi:PAS domain S-box-containing protein
MKQNISILLVEDDEDDYILTTACLKDIPGKKFEIYWARNYNEALEKLREHTYDICLFDYLLGARTGLDLLRQTRALEIEAPIILLTGRGDRDIDYEAMRLGATDYLIKSELQPEQLERALRYAMEHAAVMKALKESEHKYRGIFEGSIDVIYLLDEHGLFTDISPSCTLLLSYHPEELSECALVDLFASEAARTAFQSLQSLKANIRDFEVELLAKDRSRKFCIITSTYHAAEDDRPAYYQGFIHDITERKRTEQQLMIVEKLAAAGRFVRMLGHEIRNPLTNINLSIEQLAVENTDRELDDYVDIIRRNTHRISQLLTDLLESANPGRLELRPCTAQDLLDRTLESALDRIRFKDIRVVKHYADAPLTISADEERLKIALLNIVINAIEVMEEKKGELQLSIYHQNETCVISIADNGSGISPENLRRIFDPYFSRKPNGLGLGLSTTLAIVRAHNGRIEVKSEEGRGSEFLIFIPLATADAPMSTTVTI